VNLGIWALLEDILDCQRWTLIRSTTIWVSAGDICLCWVWGKGFASQTRCIYSTVRIGLTHIREQWGSKYSSSMHFPTNSQSAFLKKCLVSICFVLFVCSLVLAFVLRAFCLLNRHSTTTATPSALIYLIIGSTDIFVGDSWKIFIKLFLIFRIKGCVPARDKWDNPSTQKKVEIP
jgi:hypothetical protein